MQNDAQKIPARLVYLDWIRVAAFFVLILYHVGMFYVTWDWHVKSDHAGHALEPAMMLVNPWRLTLLFLVSGAATRFMADKMPAGALAGRRTIRLLIPLVFAMAVIVPPQSYYEVVEKIGYSGTYLAFWARYLAGDPGFCDADGCLSLPTWNHLWFVVYLLAYTLLLSLALAVARGPLLQLGAFLSRNLRGPGLLVWPILFLAGARLGLFPYFEVNHAFVGDWYNHAVSFAAFLFGFLVMKDGNIAAECIRLRHIALGLFLAAFALYASYVWAYRADDAVPPEALRIVMRVVYAVDQWAAIVAVLGYGARHLTRDTPLLRTLTEAVFPFYIAHQTIIVVAGHQLKALHLPALAEGALLVSITIAGCWLTYEIARRSGPLRPLLGLAWRKRSRPAPSALDRMPAAD